MQIVSVVRDFEMYNRLVKNNEFNKGAAFIAFDNNSENIFIPKRYNDFLDNYDYSKPDWFVFCHEDWQLQEDLGAKLAKLNKNNLYGPIGITTKSVFHRSPIFFCGQIKHSDKTGKQTENIGCRIESFVTVDTFDCQCIIVHSSLIKKHNLRFDENLSWDLYVEDFCINAKEKHNVKSMAIQIDCQHYSKGDVQPRFFEQLKYLNKKYKNIETFYLTTVLPNYIGNRKKHRLFKIKMKTVRFFYRHHYDLENKTITIKIFKIPVYKKAGK